VVFLAGDETAERIGICREVLRGLVDCSFNDLFTMGHGLRGAVGDRRARCVDHSRGMRLAVWMLRGKAYASNRQIGFGLRDIFVGPRMVDGFERTRVLRPDKRSDFADGLALECRPRRGRRPGLWGDDVANHRGIVSVASEL